MDDPYRPGRTSRSDYLAVYQAGGADALNELLRRRYPLDEVRCSELTRMAQSGDWEVAWDLGGEDGVVIRRLPER